MKTILNLQNVSKYSFSDATDISLQADCVIVGDSENPDLIIADLNQSNCVLVENITEPDDWFGGKYYYSNNSWSLVDGWIDPRLDIE